MDNCPSEAVIHLVKTLHSMRAMCLPNEVPPTPLVYADIPYTVQMWSGGAKVPEGRRHPVTT
jgi:hypothetical protein